MLTTLLAHSAFWKTGDYNIELHKSHEGSWMSSDCLKGCQLIVLANDFYKTHNLSTEELVGGKNPGSVLCKKLGGRVLYLENLDTIQAFCQREQQVVSLDLLVQ
jgi:hypothetical protein